MLLDENNKDGKVYADSAYASKDASAMSKLMRYEDRVCQKGARYKKLTKADDRDNYTIAKTRSRVEHVFGRQSQFGGKLIRCVGIVRAEGRMVSR